MAHDEESVIVNTIRDITDITHVHQLEYDLENAINEGGEGVGEYDRHEITTDFTEAFFYMSGPNAEALYETILPVLTEHDLAQDAIVTLGYNSSSKGTNRKRVTITSSTPRL